MAGKITNDNSTKCVPWWMNARLLFFCFHSVYSLKQKIKNPFKNQCIKTEMAQFNFFKFHGGMARDK